MIKYNKLLAKYKNFWDKFSNDIKTKFDNELAYNEKYQKKKSGKVKKHFYDDGIPMMVLMKWSLMNHFNSSYKLGI